MAKSKAERGRFSARKKNGVAERFIRTLTEQLLWVRTFQIVEDLRRALHDWLRLYNEQWLVEQHGFRSSIQVRRDFQATIADPYDREVGSNTATTLSKKS